MTPKLSSPFFKFPVPSFWPAQLPLRLRSVSPWSLPLKYLVTSVLFLVLTSDLWWKNLLSREFPPFCIHTGRCGIWRNLSDFTMLFEVQVRKSLMEYMSFVWTLEKVVLCVECSLNTIQFWGRLQHPLLILYCSGLAAGVFDGTSRSYVKFQQFYETFKF